MPDLNLEPHEYAHRDPRTGKMVRDFSPRWARNWLIVAVSILGFIYWHRAEVTPDILFGVTAGFAFCAGIFFANWLKNVY